MPERHKNVCLTLLFYLAKGRVEMPRTGRVFTRRLGWLQRPGRNTYGRRSGLSCARKGEGREAPRPAKGATTAANGRVAKKNVLQYRVQGPAFAKASNHGELDGGGDVGRRRRSWLRQAICCSGTAVAWKMSRVRWVVHFSPPI